jgi:hypothetical protein
LLKADDGRRERQPEPLEYNTAISNATPQAGQPTEPGSKPIITSPKIQRHSQSARGRMCRMDLDPVATFRSVGLLFEEMSAANKFLELTLNVYICDNSSGRQT